jgi:hypothetical protein
MRIPKLQAISCCVSIAVLAALALLPACSVSVKDHNENGNSKVDINTPVGGIHVDEKADARDTGLPVYPGARKKPKTKDGDEKSANVNISTFGFGLKVVALEYETDDPPAKVIAYYEDQLKKFGKVLQCHTNKHGDDSLNFSEHDSHASEELKCDGDNNGKTVELKTGTKDNQHIVSIDPEGKGSDFAIVWVRVRGKEGEI